MKKIKLTKGYEAIVDDEDYEYLNQWKWHYSCGYAVRERHYKAKPKTMRMHRVVNNTPEGMITDHINRNTLDNRRCNLRTVTNVENQRNKVKSSRNTSGVTGVSWHTGYKRWIARVNMKNKRIELGSYINFEDAVRSRIEGEKKYYGQVYSVDVLSTLSEVGEKRK